MGKREVLTLSHLVFFLLVSPIPHAFGESPYSVAQSACTSDESWRFGQNVESSWREKISQFVNGSLSTPMAFLGSIQLQKEARLQEAQLLGVYWKNRVFYQVGLIHMASSGFNWLASQPIQPEAAGVQLAALECLNQIQRSHPRLHLSEKVEGQLAGFQKWLKRARVEPEQRKWMRQILWEAAGGKFRKQISDRVKGRALTSTLGLLIGSGPHLALANGIHAIEREKYPLAIRYLREFLKAEDLPESLLRYRDSVRLSLARAYAKQEEYRNSVKLLKKIEKDSNEIVQALVELAWAQYMMKDYGNAVGSVMNLQTGGLRETFAPQGLMVMAMATNELCQYPSSLRAIRYIKLQYKDAYYWLRDRSKSKKRDDLYDELVAFLEKGESKVPKAVLSEWVRSPVFMAHQGELNLYVDESESEKKFREEQVATYRQMQEEYQKRSAEIKEEVRSARLALEPGESLPEELRVAMQDVKARKSELKELKGSINTLRKIARLFRKKARVLEKKLVQSINQDLATRSKLMLRKLKEVAENSYLVEVEIYNGASEDVVWQNAHPDYKEFTRALQKEKAARTADRVWNWGQAQRTEDGLKEVWADELGTIRVDVADNCGNKDRYLDVKFDLASIK